MAEHEAAAEQTRGVVGERAHGKPGSPTENLIEQADDPTREICGEGVSGNGELRDDPLRPGESMGKDSIEQLLQLLSGKTVEEEVRNNQVVASGGFHSRASA